MYIQLLFKYMCLLVNCVGMYICIVYLYIIIQIDNYVYAMIKVGIQYSFTKNKIVEYN